jgi:2'-5' RNA ligase
MVADKNLYAVALTFSDKIEKAFFKLRENFQPYINYTIVPHITLVYPFSPVFSLFKVNEQLEKVARLTKPFEVSLNRIEFFENSSNIAYAAVERRRAVKKLHVDIVKALEGLIKEWDTDGRFNLEKFIPHVTLGVNIPAAVFPDIKKRLSNFRLRYSENISEFSLFSQDNENWQVKRIYGLSK